MNLSQLPQHLGYAEVEHCSSCLAMYAVEATVNFNDWLSFDLLPVHIRFLDDRHLYFAPELAAKATNCHNRFHNIFRLLFFRPENDKFKRKSSCDS